MLNHPKVWKKQTSISLTHWTLARCAMIFWVMHYLRGKKSSTLWGMGIKKRSFRCRFQKYKLTLVTKCTYKVISEKRFSLTQYIGAPCTVHAVSLTDRRTIRAALAAFKENIYQKRVCSRIVLPYHYKNT
jgi:hypothetical protein